MDKIPNSSFNSFPVYNPNASVLKSSHEIESLASKLQKTTLQEASPQAPLPHPMLSELRVASPPEVKLELGVSPEGLAEGDGRHLPLPPQLKQAVTNYLEQVHGGGLSIFDSPMLQNYLEKIIQEALRQVTQARTPPHPTLSELRAAGPPEAKFELGVSPEGPA